MKKFFALSSFLSAVLLFMACQPEAEDPLANYDSSHKGAEITISRNSWSAPADSGRVVVKVTSSYTWIVDIPEESQDWVSVSQTWGDSLQTYKIYIYAAPNNTPDVRTCKLAIRSGKARKIITITQCVAPLVLDESDVQDFDKYYKPQEFNFDMLRSDSKWSWCRSKQSEHFVVFWDKEYGEYGLYGDRKGAADTSPSTCKTSNMRVDIDDLLKKAEQYYDVNVNSLKFADVASGKSVLNKYKMEIYILYQSEWLATGSGYDNTIGALWVNPSTCQPVGSTIAHEIGHSFQYMVYCDYLLAGGTDNSQGPGWRYGFGANGAGGCGWWEQCAQWQSFQSYKSEAFSSYYSDEFYKSTYLHIHHERPRYANYFIQWWWAHKYGLDFIGRLWREAQYPEDPCETYMRLNDMSVAAFNDDMWLYAAHCMTFDFDEIRTEGKNYIGRTAITNISRNGDYWRINDAKAPETTGSNAILLNNAAGKTVTADFQGLYEMTGTTYKCGPQSNAGWRYGFVSYNKDGSTTYSQIFAEAEGKATFEVPVNSSKLWFVVSGAPKRYERHAWPTETAKADKDTDDNKWPWQAKFTGTNPSGK